MSKSRRTGPRYVKPYDVQEKHLPECNYCGPGTNVTRRIKERVLPMNRLDRACKSHDIDTESRGPQRAKTNRDRRFSDLKLARAAKKIALDASVNKRERALAWVVHRAMIANKWRQSRRS